jgi:flavin-dependent dehydrogenase
MKKKPRNFDVFILGAGPAGLSAAIRLLDMGYAVGMLEQEQFPREQIGESLSPGIYNIFEYLNATHLLEDTAYGKNISAKVIWENKEQIYHRSSQENGGTIVDRSKLDQELLKFAVSKGLFLIQPGKLKQSIHAQNGWILEMIDNLIEVKIAAKIVLDARGRKGTLLKERIHVAPSSIAAWTHIDSTFIFKETVIEAVEEGWLWGAPVSSNRYRIMAFTDSISLKTDSSSSSHLLDLVNKTKLFSPFANKIESSFIETCSVTSYVCDNPWDKEFIKIGEAAFTLDPLSSTGVEKAMRFSLQVAIAVNTFFKDPYSQHPKDFYEEKLIESVVNHAHWTAEYYQQAWPSSVETEFWKKRANFRLDISKNKSDFASKLVNEFNKERHVFENIQNEAIPVDYILNRLWNEELIVSPKVTYESVYSINNDCIEIKQAICHPNLERPMIYLDHVELNSVFKYIKGNKVSTAIGNLNSSMPLDKAKKILVFLWSKQLLLVNEYSVKI